MWQLKMLFALEAVCLKLTVRQIKTEELQIWFRKKPFGVQGFVPPCRLKLELTPFSCPWEHPKLLVGDGSRRGQPWKPLQAFWVSAGRGKERFNEDVVCFPCRVSLLRQRPPALLPRLRRCADLLWHQPARNPGQCPEKGKCSSLNPCSVAVSTLETSTWFPDRTVL